MLGRDEKARQQQCIEYIIGKQKPSEFGVNLNFSDIDNCAPQIKENVYKVLDALHRNEIFTRVSDSKSKEAVVAEADIFKKVVKRYADAENILRAIRLVKDVLIFNTLSAQYCLSPIHIQRVYIKWFISNSESLGVVLDFIEELWQARALTQENIDKIIPLNRFIRHDAPLTKTNVDLLAVSQPHDGSISGDIIIPDHLVATELLKGKRDLVLMTGMLRNLRIINESLRVSDLPTQFVLEGSNQSVLDRFLIIVVGTQGNIPVIHNISLLVNNPALRLALKGQNIDKLAHNLAAVIPAAKEVKLRATGQSSSSFGTGSPHDKLMQSLEHYITRIEKYPFTEGFWFFKSSRSFNREINYRLAMTLKERLMMPLADVGELFKEANINALRKQCVEALVREKMQNNMLTEEAMGNILTRGYKSRYLFDDFQVRGINSSELNTIIKQAQKSCDKHEAPQVKL